MKEGGMGMTEGFERREEKEFSLVFTTYRIGSHGLPQLFW